MRAGGALIAVILIGTLSACGERPQVVNYKQGEYQGKPDTPAWENPPYNGDYLAWQKAIDGRARYQNEYNRVTQ
jgi:hypothetical protein